MFNQVIFVSLLCHIEISPHFLGPVCFTAITCHSSWRESTLKKLIATTGLHANQTQVNFFCGSGSVAWKKVASNQTAP